MILIFQMLLRLVVTVLYDAVFIDGSVRFTFV